MSTDTPMTLEYAEWLASHLIERLSGFVERIAVAGSVRRRRASVNDIELVAQPYLHPDLFDAHSTPILDPLRLDVAKIGMLVKNGDRYMRFKLIKAERYVDLFLVWPPARWGSIMAIRTGPPELGKYVVTKARDRGIVHVSGHAIRTADGSIVPTDTEEEFFSLAGLRCPEPHERDSFAQGLEW